MLTLYRSTMPRIALQHRLGGDQQAGRAAAALQRRMLQEFALQRRGDHGPRHALNGFDRAALRLDRQRQARAGRAAVASGSNSVPLSMSEWP